MLDKSRPEFIVDAPRREAEGVLLHQRVFALDDKGYRAFLTILDESAPANEELKRLIHSKPAWPRIAVVASRSDNSRTIGRATLLSL